MTTFLIAFAVGFTAGVFRVELTALVGKLLDKVLPPKP